MSHLSNHTMPSDTTLIVSSTIIQSLSLSVPMIPEESPRQQMLSIAAASARIDEYLGRCDRWIRTLEQQKKEGKIIDKTKIRAQVKKEKLLHSKRLVEATRKKQEGVIDGRLGVYTAKQTIILAEPWASRLRAQTEQNRREKQVLQSMEAEFRWIARKFHGIKIPRYILTDPAMVGRKGKI